MTACWVTVPGRSLFRRTALERKHRIEQWQVAVGMDREALHPRAELMRLGVPVDVQLRVSPRRWHGFWRVEQLA